MTTLENQIRHWLHKKDEKNATHMLVVCDTFDYIDYPIYATSKEEAELLYEQYNDAESMSIVMEVYNLSMDIEQQLNEMVVLNF